MPMFRGIELLVGQV